MKVKIYIIILLCLWIGANYVTVYSEKSLTSKEKTKTAEEEYYGGLDIIRVEDEYSKIDERIKFPKLISPVYLVADLETGEIIESKDADSPYAIASITKMMTALVSLDTIDQYSAVNITQQAIDTLGQAGNLRAGEILSANELLYPLLLESSNDAGEALAIFAGKPDFIRNMNNRAFSIGMSETTFDDASGLSAKNISTANDLLKMTMYIYKNNPELFGITQKREYRLGRHVWRNNSRYVNDKKYLGGKNGFTDAAKKTQIVLYDLPLSAVENRKIAIVLMQSNEIEKDVRDILFYLLRNIQHGR